MHSFTSQSSSCPSDSESSGSVHSQNSQDIVDCEVARSYLFEPYATDNGEGSGGGSFLENRIEFPSDFKIQTGK